MKQPRFRGRMAKAGRSLRAARRKKQAADKTRAARIWARRHVMK